jgi:hypothetical protein
MAQRELVLSRLRRVILWSPDNERQRRQTIRRDVLNSTHQ